MTHLALYREWRPIIFDDVVEQKHAVYPLRQSVISGQIAHAYLFSGTRGTGKTTLAKIFARAINCLQPVNGNPCNQCTICRGMLDGNLMDIVEMDAASNNSVDNIRRICDEVVFMPAQARYKVYIIDEVHMLSTGAFNALLKTLEEPPAHAVFILATTEPHRIPATILSRCQRYEFRRIPVNSMVVRLAEIAQADGISVSADALQTIAGLADGAMRDAISLLDQARASFAGKISRDDILGLTGVVRDEFMQQVALALIHSDAPGLLELVDQLVMAGRDLARFVTDLAQHFRNVLICQVSENPQQLVHATSDTLAAMKQLSGLVDGEQLVNLIKGLSALLSDLRWAADARTALEIGLIRLMGPQAAQVPQPQSISRSSRPVAAASVPSAVKATTPVSAPSPAPAATPVVAVLPVAAAVPPVPAIVPPMAKAAITNPASNFDPGPVPPPEADYSPVPEPELEPELVPEPEPEPELEPELELAPEPATTLAKPIVTITDTPAIQSRLPVQAAPAVPASATTVTDPVVIWQGVLDYLLAEGHMTLYLFSRPARPQLNGNILELRFAAGDKVNFGEASLPGSVKILRSAASRLAGRELDVRPLLADEAKPALEPDQSQLAGQEDDWIRKIKKTADTLGIPVKMEE